MTAHEGYMAAYDAAIRHGNARLLLEPDGNMIVEYYDHDNKPEVINFALESTVATQALRKEVMK